MISVDEAFRKVAQTVNPLPIVSVDLAAAVGMTLASDVNADRDSPPWKKSVMDGFAVQASDIRAGAILQVVESVTAGSMPTLPIGQGQATRIMTGAPLPKGADAVVMIERCELDEAAGQVTINLESLASGRHVLGRAENFAAGQAVFSAGSVIRDIDVGLLAEVGAAKVNVYQRPTAAVLPTGDELVDAATMPTGPQIRNSNGPMLIAMLRSKGIVATDLGVGSDDRDVLRKKMKTGLKEDLLILSGGVSAGTLDLVPELLEECGVQPVFHKIKMKPGKPVFFGVHRRTDGRSGYVFGLPGNPVSSLVGFRLLVYLALERMAGSPQSEMPAMPHVRLSKDHQTRGDRPTFWPGRIVDSGTAERHVEPLQWKGSSDLMTLAQAEGLIEFATPGITYPQGETLPFWKF